MGRRREYFLKGVQEGQIPLFSDPISDPIEREGQDSAAGIAHFDDPNQFRARLEERAGRALLDSEIAVITARVLRDMPNDELTQKKLNRFLKVYGEE